MGLFAFFKKRTPQADAKWREKQIMDSMEKLLELGTIEDLEKRLLEDFGIDKKDARYAEIRKIYEDEKRRR